MTESRSRLPPYVLEALKWLFTTIGLSGILLAIGFISDFAYQDRLGYKLSSTEDLAGYSLEAGRFLVSAATMVLSWLWAPRHFLVLVMLVLIAALLDFGRRLFTKSRSVSRTRIAGGLFLILIVTEIVLLDVPTVYLRAVLVRPISPPESLDDSLIAKSLTRGFWEDEICSRIEVDEYGSLRNFVENVCSLTPTEHRHRKVDRFVLNLLLTMGLSLVAIRFVIKSKPEYLLLVSLLVFILIDLLMLPYSYSKTIRPTTADDVIVSWKGNAQSEKKENEPASSAQGSDLIGESEPPKLFNLLYKRNEEVVLLNRDPADPGIWIVPREEVRLLQIVDERDVYQLLVRQRIGLTE
jgi:hypothetical protein